MKPHATPVMVASVWFLWLALAPLAATRGQEDYRPAAHRLKAAEALTEEYLRGCIRFLADDLLEGRAPGTRGDRLAQLYLATEFQKLGLKPAFGSGGWLQPVALLGMTTRCPEQIVFRSSDGRTLSVRYLRDYVAVAGVQREQIELGPARVVFVGYGIVAPEYNWDDYKDVDVRGKIVLIVNNDPADDPELFEGEARTYYGRWDYKYAEAARHGAAAAIIIHTTPSAGYPWDVVESSWSGEQFQLRGSRDAHPQVEMWLSKRASAQLVALGGYTLEELFARARRRDFRPIDLGIQLRATFRVTLRPVDTANVVGLLPGSDRPEEAIIYTAHFDHLGVDPAEVAAGRDGIYNGALDNASGTAGLLALARAFAAQRPGPRRSIVFAAVAAEEQGLLGSRYLATHLPASITRPVACLNLDGMNIWGRTRDVTVIGLGRSSLDRWILRVAHWQGRTVRPDQFPDRGFYFRSDHFSFALQGIPAVSLDTGTDFIGQPPDWGRRVMEQWERKHYHRPSDEYSDSWNLGGAVQDLVLWYLVGSELADSGELPDWSSPHARPKVPQ